MQQHLQKIRQCLPLTIHKLSDLYQQPILPPDIPVRHRKKLLEADLQRITCHLQILNRNFRFSQFLSLSRSGHRSCRRPMRRCFTGYANAIEQGWSQNHLAEVYLIYGTLLL